MLHVKTIVQYSFRARKARRAGKHVYSLRVVTFWAGWTLDFYGAEDIAINVAVYVPTLRAGQGGKTGQKSAVSRQGSVLRVCLSFKSVFVLQFV